MRALKLPTLRLIPFNCYSASFNMAADEYLLEYDDPVIRFYGWKNPSLSFGKSNFNPIGLNPEILNDPSVDKVRRLSGGKTVLHQFELTYAFACHSDLFPPSTLETYRLISQPLANALINYGLAPRMKKTGKLKSNSLICFKEISSYELAIGAKKIVGSAQYRRRKHFMQHGSILLKIDWDFWKTTWCIPRNSDQLEKRMTSFNDELGRFPDELELADTIQKEYASFFGTRLNLHDFSDSEMTRIDELRGKYAWRGFE